MLRKFLTVFTVMGISLLAVNVDTYKRFKPNQSYATKNNYSSKENNNVTKTEFGRTEDGQTVYLYTLTNTNGLVAKITNYGAILTELHLPDSKVKLDDVVLGFDSLEDYYVLNGESDEIKLAATVYDPPSGRVMELHTNQPGMQFFSGNFGELETLGKGGVIYQKHQGLCLETQHFPNSVNQLNFPSTILRPGETYHHLMVHKFYTKQHKLAEIIAPNAQVEKVVEGFEFIEGPLWHPDGFLLFSDIPADTIYKWQPGKKIEIFRQPSGNSNGNTLDKSGRLITAEHGNRRVSLTEKNGNIITLANRYQGKQLNSPNDLVVKSDGSIYFTDPPYGIEPEQEELGFYGVYRLAPDGTLTLLVDDFVRPNGIAFSPDETKLYVNDSEEGHIRVFDVRSDGMLKNGKVFAELELPSEKGAADGMKVDVKGNIYSTAPGGVWVFSPQGDLLGIIETPEPPANIAWGDDDYQTLYITARTALYRIRLQIPGMP